MGFEREDDRLKNLDLNLYEKRQKMTLTGYWLIDTDGLSVEQDLVTIFQWPVLPVTQAQLGAVECLEP